MKPMDAEQVILTRLLPKTGLETLFETGDDGDLQVGWWKGKKVTGNRDRFIAKLLNSDNVIIDLATGLMWAKYTIASINRGGDAVDFEGAVVYPQDKEYAGFNDWRLPNILELISIINFGAGNPAIYDDFSGFPVSGGYWSSTTCVGADAFALTVLIECGAIALKGKTGFEPIFCVRGGR